MVNLNQASKMQNNFRILSYGHKKPLRPYFEGFLGFYSYVFMINPSLFYKTNQIIDRQLKSIIKNEKI